MVSVLSPVRLVGRLLARRATAGTTATSVTSPRSHMRPTSTSTSARDEDRGFTFDAYLWKRQTSRELSSSSTEPFSTEAPSTLVASEVDKFRAMADAWWDLQGVCQPLHSMNRLRVDLVRQGLQSTGRVSAAGQGKTEPAQPLAGVSILDVGCGGGILSEPLARLGATVTGVDAAEENIRVAREHAARDAEISSRLTYISSTVEDFARSHPDARFDAVVASEILEHVDQQAMFIRTCADLLPQDGSLFVTTLNRTQQSYLAGIVAAECVLGLLPRGTHDWYKFVKPEELDEMLLAADCQTRLIHSMFYWPVFNQWTWVPQSAVNYAVHSVKRK